MSLLDFIEEENRALAAELPQRSLEWLESRRGRITASKAGCIVAPRGIGETGWKYLRLKRYEIQTGRLAEFAVSNKFMEHGILNEQRALEAFSQATGIALKGTPGTILKDKYLAASPDSLTEEHLIEVAPGWALMERVACTVEVKCPATLDQHLCLKEATDGPSLKKASFDYWAQVQMQLYVTGLSHGYFVSFYTAMLDWQQNPVCPLGSTEPLPDDLHWCRIEADPAFAEVFEERMKVVVAFLEGGATC